MTATPGFFYKCLGTYFFNKQQNPSILQLLLNSIHAFFANISTLPLTHKEVRKLSNIQLIPTLSYRLIYNSLPQQDLDKLDTTIWSHISKLGKLSIRTPKKIRLSSLVPSLSLPHHGSLPALPPCRPRPFPPDRLRDLRGRGRRHVRRCRRGGWRGGLRGCARLHVGHHCPYCRWLAGLWVRLVGHCAAHMGSRLSPAPCRRFPHHPRPLPPLFARPTCVVLLVHLRSPSLSSPPQSEDFAWWPSASFWSALSSSSSPHPRPRSSCQLASLDTRFAFPSPYHPIPLPPGPLLVPPYDSVCPVPDAPVHATGATAAPFSPVPLQTSPCAVTSYTRPALISARFSFVCVPSGGSSALLPLCPPFPSLPLTALVANLAASALPSR